MGSGGSGQIAHKCEILLNMRFCPCGREGASTLTPKRVFAVEGGRASTAAKPVQRVGMARIRTNT